MSNEFGEYVRRKRLELQANKPGFTLRKVAEALDVQPSFLSKVERGDSGPPSEENIKKLAGILGENPDVLLALAGKVSKDLREAIIKRPKLFAELIRQVKDAPEQAVLRIAREVRDGNW